MEVPRLLCSGTYYKTYHGDSIKRWFGMCCSFARYIAVLKGLKRKQLHIQTGILHKSREPFRIWEFWRLLVNLEGSQNRGDLCAGLVLEMLDAWAKFGLARHNNLNNRTPFPLGL